MLISGPPFWMQALELLYYHQERDYESDWIILS